jgi:hypothetical protein
MAQMEVDADGNASILRLPFATAFMTGSVELEAEKPKS